MLNKGIVLTNGYVIDPYRLMHLIGAIICAFLLVLSSPLYKRDMKAFIRYFMILFMLALGFAYLTSFVLHLVIEKEARAGLTSYGAILGILLGAYLYAREHRLKLSVVLDDLSAVGPLFYAMGRIGCYLAGCCYGRATQGPLWVVFPNETVFRHPVQLYDSAAHLLFFLWLFPRYFTQRFPGEIVLLFLFGNSFIRYFMEFFRWGASSFVVHGWMTLTQILTLLLMGFSAVGMWVLSRNVAQGTLKPVEVER